MTDKPPSEDWWDALYGDDQPKPSQAPGPEQVPRYVIFERVRDRDPEARANRKAQALAFNGAAAGLGWLTGTAQLALAALEDAGQAGSPSGAIVIGVGLVIAATIADRYGRAAAGLLPEPVQPVVRFLARVPLATAVLALALYSPNWSAS